MPHKSASTSSYNQKHLAPYMTFDTLDSSIHMDAAANTVVWHALEAFQHLRHL